MVFTYARIDRETRIYFLLQLSYVTSKLKSLKVTLLHERLYKDRFPDPGKYTRKMLTQCSNANRDF